MRPNGRAGTRFRGRPIQPAGSGRVFLQPVVRTARMKRLFDVVVASVMLVALAPLFVVVGLAVRLILGSPVLFRQRRPGWHGIPFELMKFRTMADIADE